MEKSAAFKIPESELVWKETPGRKGVFTLLDFPEEFYDLTPSEATLCSGTWGELALAMCVESEDAYMLVRDDLRNPGARLRIYVPKTCAEAEAKFRSAVEEIVRGIPSWIGELPEDVKFPIVLAWLNVRETSRAVRTSLLGNPITNPCFESLASDEKAVSAIIEITRNWIRAIKG